MSQHPSRIDRYDIVYKIASGGMAAVYVGHLSGPAGFEKLVAIKVIHPHLAEQKALIDMFLDEARHSARLHHPNVGEVLEVGEQDGLHYMVSELILGQNLDDVAKRTKERGRPLSQYHIAHIMHEAARGLDAAHRLTDSEGNPLNLVHRDVSPRNVLVSYQGQVKLIDFGVAWAKNKTSRTVAGAVKGTTAYLAPELIRGHPPDPRSDIFSAGVVLYELVTGVHPFPAESEAHRLHAILTEDIRPPSAHYPGIDPELENIIMRSLARNKDTRFDSARRLCDSLACVCEKSGVRLGTSALSDILQDVFLDEIAKHDDRIRMFKAGVRHSNSSSAPPEGKRPREGLALPEFGSDIVDTRTPAGSQSPPPKNSARRRAHPIPILIATSLLAGIFLWITDMGGAQQSSKSTSSNQVTGREQKRDTDSTTEETHRTVRLTFELSPPDAFVSFNDGPVTRGDEELRLPADNKLHLVTFTAPGHETREVELKADQDRHVVITLEPKKTSYRANATNKGRPSRRQNQVTNHETGDAKDKIEPDKKNDVQSKNRSKRQDALLNNPYD